MNGPLIFDTQPIVVDVVRNGVVESSGTVDAAVVDDSGSVVAQAGNPDVVVYFRSSLKPVQAAVCLEQGWKPDASTQIAIACSSHNAEPAHLAAVRSIFASAGISEDALRCPPALPLYDLEAARAGEPRRILRDCSGKHAAFLATCVARGWPLETYLEPDHPLQRAILDRTGELAGGLDGIGIDGCGAPTPATRLSRIARAFGAGIASAPPVRDAMRAHPFLVAGTNRVCTAVMETVSGDLVMKAGAEGIVCFTSNESGLSGAVKVRDGGARFVPPAIVHVLHMLRLVNDAHVEKLSPFATPPVMGGGLPNGSLCVRR